MSSDKNVVMAYLEAHNRHDMDAVLALFAPDIRFEMSGLWVRVGIEEMRSLEAWDKVVNSQLTFKDLRVQSGRMTCKAEETNDWLKMVGIEAVYYDTVKFEFENDVIRHIRVKIASKSEMAIDRGSNKVVRWAFEAEPDTVHQVIPRGQLLYSEENAHKWIALVQKWREHASLESE